MFDFRSSDRTPARRNHDQTGDHRRVSPSSDRRLLRISHSPQRGEPEPKSKLEPGNFYGFALPSGRCIPADRTQRFRRANPMQPKKKPAQAPAKRRHRPRSPGKMVGLVRFELPCAPTHVSIDLKFKVAQALDAHRNPLLVSERDGSRKTAAIEISGFKLAGRGKALPSRPTRGARIETASFRGTTSESNCSASFCNRASASRLTTAS